MSNTNTNYVDVLLQDLWRHFAEERRVAEVSRQFSALKTNAARVEFVHGILEENDLLPPLCEDRKTNEGADKLRREGNEMFRKRRLGKAVELYTGSVAFAEPQSEKLALAYANRSAVLFEAGLQRECLMDIDRALENPYPDALKPKLLARQQKANQSKHNQPPYAYFQPPATLPSKNPLIQCAADSVEIKNSEGLGRHVVAKRDIAIGEVLAVERPFCHFLIEQSFTHCHECLRLCYNLIPCQACKQVLFCSDKCRKDASVYHGFECKILATVKRLGMDKLTLLPLKIAFKVRDEYQAIGEDYSWSEGVYRSDRYKEVHNLVANTESRSVTDLFDRATRAAVLYHLVKSYTDFFQTVDEEVTFKELVLLHLQTAACNFHEISEMSENEAGCYESSEIGAGAYPFLSLFNHKCSPNVVRHCHGTVIVIKAIESIKAGAQCCDNYGYHHAVMGRSERQAKLKKQYFFDCACETCQHNWPLFDALPELQTSIQVSDSDYLKLQNGDVEATGAVLAQVLPRISELEKVRPNKNFAELQEVLKQCYGLRGNVRRTM